MVLVVGALALVPGAAPVQALDLFGLDMFLLLERTDGVPNPTPWVFDSCVFGTGFQQAELVTPLDVTKPYPSQPGEPCIVEMFATKAALVAAFPNGAYTFRFRNGSGVLLDQETVSFNLVEPTASIDITSPVHGATNVNPTVGLPVTWTILDKGGCNLANLASCNVTVIQTFLFEPATDTEVDEQMFTVLPVTQTTIPASALAASTAYRVEAETANEVSSNETTDTLGDAYSLLLGFEDTNGVNITTPEPSALLLQLVALASVGGLVRQRRSRKGRA